MPRQTMRTTLAVASLAVTILAASTPASAQFPGNDGAAGTSPAAPPALLAPLPSGTNTSGVNQPGAPNTSTPGIIGTGATPSGLIGESTHHPGYPGRHPK